MVFEKSLTAMVKGIRAHRGKETEYINTCLGEIHKELQSKNLSTKSGAVLKLAYLNMLGYDMSWSTFSVVEVMSHNRFAIKRPGYLASAICFNENTDVGLLTINLFKKDFGSKSQYESGMAISCLSNICTPDISRDILQDLLAMLSSSRAYLRKKTVLCLFRIFLKDPPALRTAFPKLKERLGDEDQGVLTATVNTFLELARKNARNYLSLVPQLYHILINTTNNWLTIKLLKVFQLLCPLEPRLPAKMIEPLTNVINTTKAQSVEYEAIRCVVRVIPHETALVALAIERLQKFLNSSDRNLRFLALDLFREVLENAELMDKIDLTDLHAKVLQSIEESDLTARKIALRLLDRIVRPASFAETVKKLIDFSKSACGSNGSDEYVCTVLRMGAKDRYALVEDFPWYLFVLADMARSVDSTFGSQVADQFQDIALRVPGVRPCAVELALSLLDGSLCLDDGGQARASKPVSAEGAMLISAPVVGACAWLLGEYHGAFEAVAAKEKLVRAVSALLGSPSRQSVSAASLAQCVWAAAKIYLGAPQHAPGAIEDLYALLEERLPTFVQSTHVDVSERAKLTLHLVRCLKTDREKIQACADIVDEPMKPLHTDAQKSIEVPADLDFEASFFEPAEVPQEMYVGEPRDTTDPYALASTYKDDLGFLAARDKQNRQLNQSASPKDSSNQTSMFYLGAKSSDSSQGAQVSDPGAAALPTAPTDPLERMRAQMLANRSGQKFEVMRDDAPPQACTRPAQSSSLGSIPATESSSVLLTPPEKELSDLQGRLWFSCFQDDYVCVYACVRARNARKQLLRVDFRCERLGDEAAYCVSGVAVKLPDGVSAQEADASGVLSIHAGELLGRNAKGKASLGLQAFVAPVPYGLPCVLSYTLATKGDDAAGAKVCRRDFELPLPATSFLVPATTSEDEIAEFVAEHRELLAEQVVQMLSFELAGRTADQIGLELHGIIGRCAGLCHLYGIQQNTAGQQGKGQKFLLVGQPPSAPFGIANDAFLLGHRPLADGSRVMCFCACVPKEESLELRLTVKTSRKDACEGVASHLALTLRELIEGRLRS